jgi:hypothetical protein
MKRWAVITVILYALLLVAFAYPVIWVACISNWGRESLEPFANLTSDNAWDILISPLFWGFVGVFALAQWGLIKVPVELSRERLRAQRSILWPAVTVTFLLANLCFWGGLSAASLVFHDHVWEPISTVGEAVEAAIAGNPVTQGLQVNLGGPLSDWSYFIAMGLLISIVWMVWGGIFYRYYRTAELEGWSRVWLRRVWRGSVLELLIAVPTHVVVRGREDCCAPAVSFMGIVTGLAVMLLCFGPGVLFLYLDRARRLQARKVDPERPVDGAPTQS